MSLLPGESLLREWKPGDLARWRHVQRGGYGLIGFVNVVVHKVGKSRVQIEAPLRTGGTRLVWVAPINLSLPKESA